MKVKRHNKILEIIENKDAEGMKKYLTKIREKIK